jgi:hypothetical protein
MSDICEKSDWGYVPRSEVADNGSHQQVPRCVSCPEKAAVLIRVVERVDSELKPVAQTLSICSCGDGAMPTRTHRYGDPIVEEREFGCAALNNMLISPELDLRSTSCTTTQRYRFTEERCAAGAGVGRRMCKADRSRRNRKL